MVGYLIFHLVHKWKMARNFNLYILVLWFNCFKLLYSQVTLSVHFVIYSAGSRKQKKGEAGKQVRVDGGFLLSVMFCAFTLSYSHTRSDELLFTLTFKLSQYTVSFTMTHSEL